MSRRSTSKRTEFLLGNEAVAAGALRAGVRFAASYPGTPSSEILPAFFHRAKLFGVEVEGGWMVNEKVAFEAALAASWCGVDSMVSMKQVGLNVAMDSLMSAAYTGTDAAMLVVSVDDPGPYSSQTEQDSRFAAMFAKIPVFDPSSPEDAYRLMEKAASLSRRMRIPTMVRPVLRVAHSRQSVEVEPPEETGFPEVRFTKRPGVWTATPKFRYRLHKELNQKVLEIAREGGAALREALSSLGGSRLIIASGCLHSYLEDLGFEALKVEMPYPLDQELLSEVCRSFSEIWVFEETYPVIEMQMPVRSNVKGRLSGHIPSEGELTPQKILEILDPAKKGVQVSFPEKKPRLCPGCGHRSVFYAIRRCFPGGIFPGDIGCYTLGTNIGAVDTFLCMGASISMGMSISILNNTKGERPVVCTIGDSTFFHAGIPPLIEAVQRKAPMVVCILDNRTTAMTGGQPVPDTDIGELVRGCGVKKLEEVHAWDLPEVMEKLKECWEFAKANGEPAVLLCKCPCVIYGDTERGKAPEVDRNLCNNCGICYEVFECPAICEKDGAAWIDTTLCTGCGVCIEVCPKSAIRLP